MRGFFKTKYASNYFFAAAFFLVAEAVLLAQAFFVPQLAEEALLLLSCSTAIDQKYSSLPCGQPAFCQL